VVDERCEAAPTFRSNGVMIGCQLSCFWSGFWLAVCFPVDGLLAIVTPTTFEAQLILSVFRDAACLLAHVMCR